MSTILCFGDSNTWGTMPQTPLRPNARYDEHQRWTMLLQKALGNSYTIIEEGQPSRTVVHNAPFNINKSGLRSLQQAMVEYSPALVLIMLGTNDLKAKFNLTPLAHSIWKMLRLRPSNFPTIRIAQLADLLSKKTRLFSEVIATETVRELQKLFQVKASKYWNTHYQFGEPVATNSEKKLGTGTINNLIINVIVPFTFVYGKAQQNEKMVDKAVQLLENIKAENNTIIRKWNTLGVESKNAMQTQSLIELKNNYCSHKKCLNCNVGNKLLQG